MSEGESRRYVRESARQRLRLCPDCSTIISNGAAFCVPCSRERFANLKAMLNRCIEGAARPLSPAHPEPPTADGEDCPPVC